MAVIKDDTLDSDGKSQPGKRAQSEKFAEDGLGGLVWGDLPYDRMDLAELQ